MSVGESATKAMSYNVSFQSMPRVSGICWSPVIGSEGWYLVSANVWRNSNRSLMRIRMPEWADRGRTHFADASPVERGTELQHAAMKKRKFEDPEMMA